MKSTQIFETKASRSSLLHAKILRFLPEGNFHTFGCLERHPKSIFSKAEMDQFRQIGEVLGSLKALMVLKHEISINQKQCCLLFDICTMAFETIAEEIRQNLRLEEKNTKWKALELPLKELHRIFKEGELYIKYCLEIRDWWGKAISLHHNKDCVEFHIHNLFCCFPVVIEAIETAAEISALDHDDMQKRRAMLMKKYDSELNNPKLFQWMLGKQYLVPRETCFRLESAWKEDRWLLLETIKEKKILAANVMVKNEQSLGDLLTDKLSGSEPELLPSWILVGAKDYHVRRRLGTGKSHIKEIHWLGENYALRNFFGEIEPLSTEISLVLTLAHPNIMQYNCAFYDKEKKEGYLVMELMQKNLGTYIKENCCQRRRAPLSISVAVDIMLQIARGMEYLHSKRIYHGDLNPDNVLLKARNSSTDGYFQAKLTGFGLTSIKSYIYRNFGNQNGSDPVICYAPEVLAEQEQPQNKCSTKYTEKADVYSFGMVCFELLTGKVPFEDNHLQGDKMVRNIRLGVRPLFPHPSPKYLANITKRCWQAKPSSRPSFSSICRILRYIKKVLVTNPDHGQPDSPPPLVDYCDIEARYSKKFPGERSTDMASVSQIPFQMFAYKLVEEEKSSGSLKDKTWDSTSEGFLAGGPSSIFGDDIEADDLFMGESDQRSVRSEFIQRKNSSISVADLRSVFSEFPNRKFASADQNSICSESPTRKYIPFTEGYHNPVHAQTPDMRMTPTYRRSFSITLGLKNSSKGTAERKSVTYNITEKKEQSTFDQKSGGAKTPEKNNSANDSSSICFENQEKTPLKTTANKTEAFPETSGVENSFASATEQRSIFLETPERNSMKKIVTQSSTCTKGQEKKAVPAKVITQQTRHNKIPQKKSSMPTKTLKDTKTSKSSSKLKQHSPRNSPTRILNGVSSPWSSPARAFREYSLSIPSPARAHKEYSTSIYSPARAPKEYSSSISSPARALKEYSSSISSSARASKVFSSPLNSRSCSTRSYKDSLVSPAMSPRTR